MLDFIKKQGIGTWITLGTVVVSLIGLIIYGAALSTGNGVQVANGGEIFLTRDQFGLATAGGVIGLLFAVAAIALAQFKFDGIVGKVVEIVLGALRIIAPAMFVFAFFQFLNGTLTGLGWTFFSNEELEINPVAISAGKLTITALIFFLVSMVAGIVGAFFRMIKKDAGGAA